MKRIFALILASLLLFSMMQGSDVINLNILNEDEKILTASKNTEITEYGKGKVAIPFSIKNPRLWNGVKDPFRYEVEVKLNYKDQVLDTQKSKLGLRYFHIDPEKPN